MKVNREIRASKIRVVDKDGHAIGILTLSDALERAEQVGLDLVEIAPNAVPPVCQIIDFGKYRYQQGKKEKESKKSQHQVRVKEIKLKPTTDEHDLKTKLRHAKTFIQEGNKVKVTCMFRGREMLHTEFGFKLIEKFCQEIGDIASKEGDPKLLGKALSVVISPSKKKKN